MSKESKVPHGRFSLKPEEEVARASSITLRPFHFFVLDILTGSEPTSVQIQSLIESAAASAGITRNDFDAIEDKTPYMKGRLPAPGKKEYKRKDYVKKGK